MQRHVARYVHSCILCQRRKRGTHSFSTGLLQPIAPPRQPFHTVGIDFLGPFPLTRSGNRYVLVAVDYLTRFAETQAVVTSDAQAVAEFFLHSIVLRHGAPQILISDRGRQFLSTLVQNFLRLCNTVHRPTTSYHPQCNGLTERLNGTLGTMLSMYVNSRHDNWDRVLPYVTFAYNTSCQASTGFSPFSLLFAREPSTTLDTILPIAPTFCDVFSQTHVAQANSVRDIARRCIERSQLHQASVYNTTHHDVQFRCGDDVLVHYPLRTPGLAQKLLPRYFGPYRILRQTGPVDYEVARLPLVSPAHTEVVHVSRLKPYYARTQEGSF